MAEILATQFSEILEVIPQNQNLQDRMLKLVDTEAIPGKATEGGNRVAMLREILRELIQSQLDLSQADERVGQDLPATSSPHYGNGHVFARGWEDRLVRIQLSRFYNQAVMEMLLEQQETQCFVPHSSSEQPDSRCSRSLAGRSHDLKDLYDRLVNAYRDGHFTQTPKIPDHPYCTHVVTRVSKS